MALTRVTFYHVCVLGWAPEHHASLPPLPTALSGPARALQGQAHLLPSSPAVYSAEYPTHLPFSVPLHKCPPGISLWVTAVWLDPAWTQLVRVVLSRAAFDTLLCLWEVWDFGQVAQPLLPSFSPDVRVDNTQRHRKD